MANDQQPKPGDERWTDGVERHRFDQPATDRERELARRIMAGEQPTRAELGLDDDQPAKPAESTN